MAGRTEWLAVSERGFEMGVFSPPDVAGRPDRSPG